MQMVPYSSASGALVEVDPAPPGLKAPKGPNYAGGQVVGLKPDASTGREPKDIGDGKNAKSQVENVQTPAGLEARRAHVARHIVIRSRR